MGSPANLKNNIIVVSALEARANLGKLLKRVEDQMQSLVIEKRGKPRAILLSIREYAKLAAPEPQVLKIIGEESKRNGTDALSPRRIDKIVDSARRERSKR